MEHERPGVSVTVERRGDVVVLRLAGEIDRTTITAVTAAIDQTLASPQRHVDVDLAGVTFFGSEGVHALGDLRNACLAAGRLLVLRHVPPMVTRVLELTGMLEHFTVVDG